MNGNIYVVGIGPGSKEHMSYKAVEVLENADIVIGYKTYINIITRYLNIKQVSSSGMMKEVERCREALSLAAEGKSVALVSSGDAGIYGMAGIMLEVIEESKSDVNIEVVPGITSSQAAAALLGAPIMHDYASISLSDLLTDWDLIKKRLEFAAKGDFVICIYNPKSKTRIKQIEEAWEILLKYKDNNTPVGIVKNAMREDQSAAITTLKKMLDHEIDMFTTIIIGNSKTFTAGGRIITPRGYNL